MSYERSMGMGHSEITTFWGSPETCSQVQGGRQYCYTNTPGDLAHLQSQGCRSLGRSCRTNDGNPGTIHCCPPRSVQPSGAGGGAGGGKVTVDPETGQVSVRPGWYESFICSVPATIMSFGASQIQCSTLRSRREAAEATAQTVAEHVVDQAIDEAVTGAESSYAERMSELVIPTVAVLGVGALGIGGLLWWRRRKLHKNPWGGRRRRGGRRGTVRQYARRKLYGARNEGLTPGELASLSGLRSSGALTKAQAKSNLDALVDEGRAEKSNGVYFTTEVRTRRQRRRRR